MQKQGFFNDFPSASISGLIGGHVQSAYPTFGSPLIGRTYQAETLNGYRFGFNGMENTNEIHGVGNVIDFGARIYDSRLGRFFSKDPKWRDYPFWSPYCFAGNAPITHVDLYGKGPDDRVKTAKSFRGTPYVQEYEWVKDKKTGKDIRTYLRSGTDNAALANIDCSELVCRVLAADGLLDLDRPLNTQGLIDLFKGDNWEKSNTPKVGDVFLWRSGGHGHTGIVSAVNADGTVEITHARGKKFGTRTETYKLSYFTGKTGWQGFFRPKTENTGAAGKAEKAAGETTESPKKSDSDVFISCYESLIKINEHRINMNNIFLETNKATNTNMEMNKSLEEENKTYKKEIEGYKNTIKTLKEKKSG